METHAMVMFPKNGGIVGRYVYFGGYPAGVGAALLEIVARDGLDMAREILVEKTPAWVCLKTDPEWLLGIHENLSYPIITGYGESEIWGELIEHSNMEEYVNACEWIYVLEDEGLRCAKIEHKIGADDVSWLLISPWSTRPSDLADLIEVEMSLATA